MKGETFFCKACEEEYPGEGIITNGYCINCYQENNNENNMALIEAEHDYCEAD